MKVAAYARVSREEQAEGYSIDAQLEAMRRYCAERGWIVAAEYVEPGFTARTDQRPVFREVLADAERGAFDLLLTHKLDRAFRSLLDQLQRLAQLDAWGVAYVSVVEQIDYSTPHGRMFMQMLGALNEWYSANLAEEVRKGKRGRAKAGRSNANTPPFGYSREPGGVDEPDLAQVGTVRRLFELYGTGRYTFQAVADALNDEGRPAGVRSVNGRWTWRAVEYALSNRFYVGEVRYGDEWYPGLHEAIIPAALFDQAQAVRRQRSTKRSRKTRHPSLLQGLLVCAHCGGRLWVDVANQRWAYYWDPAARRGLDCPAAGVYVPQAEIDEQVGALVSAMRLPDDWREGLVELARNGDERREIGRRRYHLEGKLARLRELYVEGDFTKSEYTRRQGEIEAQIDALAVPEPPDLEQAAAQLETIGQVWPDARFETRREIVQTLFRAVTVDPLSREVVRVELHKPFGVLMEHVAHPRRIDDGE